MDTKRTKPLASVCSVAHITHVRRVGVMLALCVVHLRVAEAQRAVFKGDCATERDASSWGRLAQQVKQPPRAVVKDEAAGGLQCQKVLLAPIPSTNSDRE